MDRAFTFADPRIIDTLSRDFIPAVGNTHELQNQKSPTGEWFMGVARAVNPRVLQNVTSQGFYVAAPDGTAYGFNNNRDPQRVMDFISTGLVAFRKSPGQMVTLAPAAAGFFRKPAEDVSVVRVFSRIKPLPKDCDVLNHSVGRDHLWIYRSDAQALLAGKGKFAMPSALANRIVRFHLVDNVRGEPVFWSASQVKSESFQVQDKGQGRYAFTGTYSMATEDNTRGLQGKIEGEILVDASAVTVKKFRAYGEAKAWGAGPYTPRPPKGRFPLVFAFVDAADEFAKTTPPQAAAYGDGEYLRAS